MKFIEFVEFVVFVGLVKFVSLILSYISQAKRLIEFITPVKTALLVFFEEFNWVKVDYFRTPEICL